jgi:integral membrane protein
MNVLEKLEAVRPFTDQEAWKLFRLAAIGEAVGWSLLISGVLFKHFVTPGNNAPVQVVGQIHGTLFLIYIAAVVALYSSLSWSRRRTIIAGLMSVPPYGSLVFEQWAAYQRQREALKTYREVVVRAIISKGNKKGDELLAIQPKDTTLWYLPGGLVQAGETTEQALQRLVLEQTGITPTIGWLIYLLQYRRKSTERLELFFVINNASDYREQQLKVRLGHSKELDDIGYLKPREHADLRPTFLQDESITDTARQKNRPVKSIIG